MADRKASIVSTFDTSGVTAGANSAVDAIKKFDKAVNSSKLDTSQIDQYNQKLDKLAKAKPIKISVDEKGLTRAEAQIKRMLKDLQLTQAMEGKGSHWRGYEQAKLDYTAKGKGAEFAAKFKKVFDANMAMDDAKGTGGGMLKRAVRAMRPMKGIVGAAGGAAEGAGGALGMAAGVGRLALAGGAGPAGIGIAAVTTFLAVAPKSIDNLMDKFADLTHSTIPGLGKSFADVGKEFNDWFDVRAKNSLSRMKEDFQVLQKEVDRLKDKAELTWEQVGQLRTKSPKAMAQELGLARTERAKGAAHEWTANPQNMQEIRSEHFDAARAEFIRKQIGAGDQGQKLEKALTERYYTWGGTYQEAMRKAEQTMGGVKQGHQGAISEAWRATKGTQEGKILEGALNNPEVARNARQRAILEARPGVQEDNAQRIREVKTELAVRKEIMTNESLTIGQKEQALALEEKMVELAKYNLSDTDYQNRKAAERNAMRGKVADAQQLETQGLREQNDLEAKLLKQRDGDTQLARQRAEIEKQYNIDKRNGTEESAKALKIERERTVELERQAKFSAETRAHGRAMAFAKAPGMSLEEQARHPELYSRMKGLAERAHQERWSGAELKQRQREAHSEVIMEKRQSTARSTFLETRTPQEALRNQMGELMGAAGMFGGPATMDQNTLQRKLTSIAIERKDQGTTGWGAVEAGTSGAYESFAKSQNEGQNIQSAMLEQLRIMASLLQQARGAQNAIPAGPVRGLAQVGGNQPGAMNPGLGLGGAY